MFKLVVVGTVCAGLAAAASQSTWGVEQNVMGTIGTSVKFVDANHGYYPLVDNGSGSNVLETRDGGETWNTLGNVSSPMFLASDVKGNNIVVSTLFGAIYSTDGGKNFENADMYSVGGQSVQFSQSKVWIPANNYVMSSSDGGKEWTTHNIDVLKTDARYIAAPSDDVIYITAGEWPQQNKQQAQNQYPFSARWTLSQHVTSDRVSAIPTFGSLKEKSSASNPTTYKMQIVKSTDGGQTWTSQLYSETLNLYFNDISCYDQRHCCAAAEGAGISVYCTSDGNNWS